MVACVVVNWNGWQDTVACLRTLAVQASTEQLEVVVVDNGSTNESIREIEACFAKLSGSSTRFRLIANGENAGFARGSNVGIQDALDRGAEFVWLLNNDTECPADTLQKLVGTARTHPQAGIVGTVLYYYDDPTTVQAWSGGHVNRWLGTSQHSLQPFVQNARSYTTFASALIRADVFRELGLLYSGYFMYYDDADFCLRMKQTRWTIAVAEQTAVLHKEGASTEGDRNPFMEETIVVSGLWFLKRFSPIPSISQVLFLLLKLANRSIRGEWAAVMAVLRAAKKYVTTPAV